MVRDVAFKPYNSKMTNPSESAAVPAIPAEETAHVFVHPDYRLLRGEWSPLQYREDILQRISGLRAASRMAILLHEPTPAARNGEIYGMFEPEMRFPTDDNLGWFAEYRGSRNIAEVYNERLAELGITTAVYHGSFLHMCVWQQIKSMHAREDTGVLFYKAHHSIHDAPPIEIPPSVTLGVVLEDNRRRYTQEFQAIIDTLRTDDTSVHQIGN